MTETSPSQSDDPLVEKTGETGGDPGTPRLFHVEQLPVPDTTPDVETDEDIAAEATISVSGVVEWLLEEDMALEEEARELERNRPTIFDSDEARLEYLGEMARIAGRRNQIRASIEKIETVIDAPGVEPSIEGEE